MTTSAKPLCVYVIMKRCYFNSRPLSSLLSFYERYFICKVFKLQNVRLKEVHRCSSIIYLNDIISVIFLTLLQINHKQTIKGCRSHGFYDLKSSITVEAPNVKGTFLTFQMWTRFTRNHYDIVNGLDSLPQLRVLKGITVSHRSRNNINKR